MKVGGFDSRTRRLQSFGSWFSQGGIKDRSGVPQVFFHGTTRDFEEFLPSHKFGRIKPRSLGGLDSQLWGVDCHAFSSSPKVAEGYAIGVQSRRGKDAVIMPVYLRSQAILEVDANGRYWRDFHNGVVILARKYAGKEVQQGPCASDFDVECSKLVNMPKPFDGVLIRNVRDEFSDSGLICDVAFVFEARNIKSATATPREVDPETYSIVR